MTLNIGTNMADTISDKFRNASTLLITGNKEKAKETFLEIYNGAKNPAQKLNAILGLLDALSPVKEIDELISYSNEALQMARNLNANATEALVKARKGNFLQNKTTHLAYERDCLKLSPDWVAFALEQEKQRYEYLDNKIKGYKKDTDQLFKEALETAGELGDLTLKGRILMMQGDLRGTDYLYKLTELVQPKGHFKTKLFNEYYIRKLRIDKYLVFNRGERKELKMIIREFENMFLQSAQCFMSAGDENMAGYSYYNLAIPLKSAFQFRKARRYLNMAKLIAEKYKDISLMTSVSNMEDALRQENRSYYERLKDAPY